MNTISCPRCDEVTTYETGGDAYSRGYGFQGFTCSCPMKEHEACVAKLEKHMARVSIVDGLPVYRLRGGAVIRTVVVDSGPRDNEMLMYFEDSPLYNVTPNE